MKGVIRSLILLCLPLGMVGVGVLRVGVEEERTVREEKGGEDFSGDEREKGGMREGAKENGLVGRLVEVEEGEVLGSDFARVEEGEGDLGHLGEELYGRIDEELRGALSEREERELRGYLDRMLAAEGRFGFWVCWGEDVPEAKVMAFHEAEKLVMGARAAYSLFANQFLSGGKWSRTATDGFGAGGQGNPAIVTWSVVPDGTTTPGLEGGTRGSDLRAWLGSIYGGSATGAASAQPWFGIFEASFAAVGEVCGVEFRYEAEDDGVSLSTFNRGILGVRGDVRLAARELDGDNGTLGFAYGPDYGEIVLDSTDGVFDNIAGNSLRLFNVLTHELGHAVGLAHVCPVNRTKLLEPTLTTSFRGPRFDEYQSLQRLYGDPFEVHGGFRDNDDLARAKVLDFGGGRSFLQTRLSVDDNSDRDFYRLSGLRGERLSVRVVPGEGSYLEGGEMQSGCGTGVTFDSTRVQDLRVAIYGAGGVLLEVNEGGLGVQEVIEAWALPEDGDYWILVDGDLTDAAQLYRLEVDLDEKRPDVLVLDGVGEIVGETGLPKNGELEAGETVRMRWRVRNVAPVEVRNLQYEVAGSANVEVFSGGFSVESVGVGEVVELEVVFGATGECGGRASVAVTVGNGTVDLLVIEEEFVFGEVVEVGMIAEGFDGSSNLSSGWTSQVSGDGVAWKPVTARSVSPLRSAFSPGVRSVSEAILGSPEVEVGKAGASLIFDHWYRLENRFDGGVLEASRNGEGWFDLLEASGVEVVRGGYDQTIRSGFGSTIAGRRAWSGELSGFVTTELRIPAAWVGERVRFRWRVVHDRSSSREGWYLDEVVYRSVEESCGEYRTGVVLEADGGGLSWNGGPESVAVRVKSELPLMEAVTLRLVAGGTAEAGDFSGNLEVVIPVGESEGVTEISLGEVAFLGGERNLELSIPEVGVGFLAGAERTVVILIEGRRGIGEWEQEFFHGGEVDLAGDFDGDGWSELAEYLLGTDPTSAASRVVLRVEVRDGGRVVLPLGELPERDDAALRVEVSDDLVGWEEIEFEVTEEGLEWDGEGGKRFVRLKFVLGG